MRKPGLDPLLGDKEPIQVNVAVFVVCLPLFCLMVDDFPLRFTEIFS